MMAARRMQDDEYDPQAMQARMNRLKNRIINFDAENASPQQFDYMQPPTFGAVHPATYLPPQSSYTGDYRAGPECRSLSESSSTSSYSNLDVVDLVDEYYEVVWRGGNLGISLHRNKRLQRPCVKRFTGKGSSCDLSSVSMGDVLLSLNKVDTQVLGFQKSIDALKSMPKPIYLVFQRTRKSDFFSNPQERESVSGSTVDDVSDSISMKSAQLGNYTVVWGPSKLGVTIKRGPSGLPTITKMMGRPNHKGMEHAELGDELVAINHEDVTWVGFKKIMKLLSTLPRPCVLTFRHAQSQRLSFTGSKRSLGEIPVRQGEMSPTSSSSSSSSFGSRRRSRTDGPESGQVRLIWQEGELGLDFEVDDMSDLPVISRIDDYGSAPTTLSLGDVLLTINNQTSSALGYEGSMELLAQLRKPIILCFQKIGRCDYGSGFDDIEL